MKVEGKNNSGDYGVKKKRIQIHIVIPKTYFQQLTYNHLEFPALIRGVPSFN